MKVHPSLQKQFDDLVGHYRGQNYAEFAEAKAHSDLCIRVYGKVEYAQAYDVAESENDPTLYWQRSDDIHRQHVYSSITEARELADQLEAKAVSLRSQADAIEADYVRTDLSMTFLEGLERGRQ